MTGWLLISCGEECPTGLKELKLVVDLVLLKKLYHAIIHLQGRFIFYVGFCRRCTERCPGLPSCETHTSKTGHEDEASFEGEVPFIQHLLFHLVESFICHTPPKSLDPLDLYLTSFDCHFLL